MNNSFIKSFLTVKRDTKTISLDCSSFKQLLNIDGFPKEQLIDIYGLEDSGKTAYILHIIAQLQKKDHFVAYIDADNKLNYNYMAYEGIDTENLVVLGSNKEKEVMDFITNVLSQKVFSLLVIDSLPAIISEKELNDSMAINHKQNVINEIIQKTANLIVGSNCTVIFISQLRNGLNGSLIEVGKKAFNMYSSISIKMEKQKDIFNEGNKIGERLNLIAEKNKLSTTLNNVHYDLLFQ